jgi:HlyB family type I secretion system ABC transporter
MARYTCVRQQDEFDCGPAAIATVALHYGLRVRIHELRRVCGTDRGGTNLLGLAEAAEQLGFTARAASGSYEAILDLPLPAIAHTNLEKGGHHYVVVHAINEREVVVADPRGEVETLSRAVFEARWTGYVLILVPESLDLRSALVQASPARRLLSLLRPHSGLLGESFVAAVLLAVLGLSTGYFVQILVDSVLVHGEWGLLNALGVGMLAITGFRVLFTVLRARLLIHVGRRVELSLAATYTRHLLNLPLTFFATRRVGEVLSRLSDVPKIRDAISGAAVSSAVDSILIVVSLAAMFAYDVRLALMGCAFAPLLVGALVFHHGAVRRLIRAKMEADAELLGRLTEDVSAIETVKTLGLERQRAEQAEDRLVGAVQAHFQLSEVGIKVEAVTTLFAGVATIAFLWYGGGRVIAGELSVGQLIFFYTLLGSMIGPLIRVTEMHPALQDALVAMDRLQEVLDEPAEERHSEGAAEFSVLKRGIEVDDVAFRYGSRENVLDGLKLRVEAGTTVGLVGESGAGKTTLLRLLMRFHEPTSGAIRFDDVDLRDLSLASLRAGIGVVSQEPTIFSGTLRENLLVARPGATPAELRAAVEAAGLAKVVDALPQRYETRLGERGASLSGGQRQRLAIARVLLKGANVVILDEATSQLDTDTEQALIRSLRRVLAGKTVICVAHRLSTVREADRIYVLGDGGVLEAGTHAELLQRDETYARLWRAQAGPALRRSA